MVRVRRLDRFVPARPTVTVALAVLVIVVAIAVFVPYLAPHRPDAIDLRGRLKPPVFFGGTMEHPFGTDALGRDVLSRILYGARISVSIGFAVVLVSGAIGTFLGLVSGYFRGWLDCLLTHEGVVVLKSPGISEVGWTVCSHA